MQKREKRLHLFGFFLQVFTTVFSPDKAGKCFTRTAGRSGPPLNNRVPYNNNAYLFLFPLWTRKWEVFRE